MSTLSHPRTPVHSNPWNRKVAPIEVLEDPIRFDADSFGFQPSPADEAYHLAFTLARAGEPNACPTVGPILAESIYMAHYRGSRAGQLAREIDLARELGYAMGSMEDSEISEPPAGLGRDEAKAYREGFAAGLADLEEEAHDLAQTEHMIAERESILAEMSGFFGNNSDMDLYPSLGM